MTSQNGEKPTRPKVERTPEWIEERLRKRRIYAKRRRDRLRAEAGITKKKRPNRGVQNPKEVARRIAVLKEAKLQNLIAGGDIHLKAKDLDRLGLNRKANALAKMVEAGQRMAS